MPYIAAEKRQRLQERERPGDAGELAYCVYCDMKSVAGPECRFWALAQVFGAVLLAALEFWRRVICPYEEKQQIKNGDV